MLTDTPLCVADVLERAADLIEPEGKWTQRVWGSRETCMCAEMAIYEAIDKHPWVGHKLGDEATDFFATLLPANPGNIVAAWNDAPERRQWEVVAKLREAATLARAGDA